MKRKLHLNRCSTCRRLCALSNGDTVKFKLTTEQYRHHYISCNLKYDKNVELERIYV